MQKGESMFQRLSLIGLMFLISAGTQASEKRLIQSSEDKVEWLDLEQISDLSAREHEKGKCPGFMDVTDFQDILSELDAQHDALRQTAAFPYLEPSFGSEVEPRIKEVSVQNMRATVEKLSSYKNRFSNSATGVEAAQWIRSQFETMAKGRNDILVSDYKHNFAQPSIVAQIEGQGDLANEIVVIGGHMDSINNNLFSSTAPGADDNASGIATVLEVFRILAESDFKPKRTLQFMGYAGEEKGLLGSIEIATQYQKQKTLVFSAMQFDMTMFPGTLDAQKPITFVVDHVDLNLTQFVKKMVTTYLKMEVRDTKCGYACSDHASWTRAGYSSVFPFESTFNGSNGMIHSTGDKIDILDVEYGSQFAKLGIAYAIEASLANAR